MKQDIDLDALMAESLEEPTEGDAVALEQAEAEESPDLLDLDALLKESKVQARERQALSEAKKRVAQGGKFGNLAEDLARIRAWEAEHVWKQEAVVATFLAVTCACGSSRRIFSGILIRESSRTSSHARRWVTPEGILPANLPRETGLIMQKSAMCEDCAAGAGWPMANPTEISR